MKSLLILLAPFATMVLASPSHLRRQSVGTYTQPVNCTAAPSSCPKQDSSGTLVTGGLINPTQNMVLDTSYLNNGVFAVDFYTVSVANSQYTLATNSINITLSQNQTSKAYPLAVLSAPGGDAHIVANVTIPSMLSDGTIRARSVCIPQLLDTETRPLATYANPWWFHVQEDQIYKPAGSASAVRTLPAPISIMFWINNTVSA